MATSRGLPVQFVQLGLMSRGGPGLGRGWGAGALNREVPCQNGDQGNMCRVGALCSTVPCLGEGAGAGAGGRGGCTVRSNAS